MAKMKDFKQRFYYLCLSIFINAAGNALAISSNLGSAVWTGSAVNLSKMVNIPLGTTLFLYGIIVTLSNQLLLGQFDRRRFFSNLLFTLPFSYLVQFSEWIFDSLGVPTYDFWWRVILDIIGLFCVAMAVSMYSRANLIMHPNDDLAYIIRFKFTHGSAVISQWLSYIPPVIITGACFLITGNIYATNFGTVFALVFQGAMMKWSDTHAFPALKHHVDL
ncbi:MAG: hypothetical protein ABF679_12710 [Lentilactobacillus diolivorans]|uniref:Sugar specific permease n=2 Tax=Lentilactobacillus diolivorans TaxID=179838 RepID=A0A0R1SJP5_9LACO|nr:hypothetical protein [Lentilactobacillus diolivorans]KRL65051.1 hypothetical protein FC85_GL000546 [Lentilactobacillus diolivorans DSM 14421]GEP23537.1 membrane protein [Lentilactobacillus diolivorans]